LSLRGAAGDVAISQRDSPLKLVKSHFCLSLRVPIYRDVAISAGAGGNRPLLFVIARSHRRRGNPVRAQDSLRVIIEPQRQLAFAF